MVSQGTEERQARILVDCKVIPVRLVTPVTKELSVNQDPREFKENQGLNQQKVRDDLLQVHL